eukprot:1724204-Pyramimonas_sp.AAC.1
MQTPTCSICTTCCPKRVRRPAPNDSDLFLLGISMHKWAAEKKAMHDALSDLTGYDRPAQESNG